MAAQRIPAKELGVALSIRLLALPTAATGPASVARVYQIDRHASLRRLVGDTLAQLEERPGVPLVAMCPTNRCSLADSRQILQSDCLAGYGGFLDELLADAVVGVVLEAGFAPPHAADAPRGVSGTDFLEPMPPEVVAS